jgi:hypothetical protein
MKWAYNRCAESSRDRKQGRGHRRLGDAAFRDRRGRGVLGDQSGTDENAIK